MAAGKILVTRPAHQAGPFLERLRSEGLDPLGFPAIEIIPIEPESSAQDQLANWQDQDLVIFISANAVRFAQPYFNKEACPLLAAIGGRTATILEELGLKVGLCPESGFNSETLLSLPELSSLQGQSVMIVKGAGGRTLLKEELRKSGANVTELEVYRRSVTTADPAGVLSYGASAEIGLITITSVEALEALIQVLGDQAREWLFLTPLLAGSSRIADAAMAAGFRNVIISADPSDESMFEAVLQWLKQKEYK
jgi:uroporphyrinogen-III synthase